MRAESNLTKLIWLVLGAVVVVFVATWLEPWMQEYELKTGAKITCSEIFKTRFNMEKPDEFFLGKATRAGVHFKQEHYDPDCGTRIQKDAKCFSIFGEHDKLARKFRCVAEMRYRTVTQWAFVGQVLQEIPPLKLSHHVKVKMEVDDRW